MDGRYMVLPEDPKSDGTVWHMVVDRQACRVLAKFAPDMEGFAFELSDRLNIRHLAAKAAARAKAVASLTRGP
jgi:hypothetical protein